MKERFVKFLFEHIEKGLERMGSAGTHEEIKENVQTVSEFVSELKSIMTETFIP